MEKRLILKRFKDMGLTSYEVKCYLSLLERDTLTVAEVSRLAAIPRPNAYEALEKMMSKGMCVAKPGATKQYSASDPSLLEDKLLVQLHEEAETEMDDFKEDLTRRLKRKEKEILEKTQAARQNVGKLITELRPQYEKSQLETSPLQYIEILKGPHQIHRRVMQLNAEAKEEILVVTKPAYTNPREKLEDQVGEGVETSKRGVRVRCIYEIARDEDEKRWQLEMINRAVNAGEEARVSEVLPMKMVVSDSRIVMLFLKDPIGPEDAITGAVIEHPDLAKSLKILFEVLWEQAQDYHILKG